ncbi:MAG: hypothetical protein SFV54_10285 [Bryobacteraceae bacterium]|nr:hypothetical protein [Bryobacteraceae bacterium]
MNYTAGQGISLELRDAPEMCVPTQRKTITLDEMRVLAWLQARASLIIRMDALYNVDRRAVAGAIAWEALQNIKGAFGVWPGPGKVHALATKKIFGVSVPNPFGKSVAEEVEELGYVRRQSGIKARYKALKDTETSVAYIAAIMRAAADVAEQNGFVMNNNPVALTEFYQGWDLDRWRSHMSRKKRGSTFEGPDAMPRWVSQNLDYLEDAVGKPSLSPACRDTRIGEPVR